MAEQPTGEFLKMLLLQSGDVETNPGPPRRAPAQKKPDSAASSKDGKDPAGGVGERLMLDKMKEYEDKIKLLEKTVEAQKKDIDNLKNIVKNLDGVEDKIVQVTAKIDAITGVYDDLHEKMHEIDKTRKNNLLFYGIKPDFLPEIHTQLEHKIHEIMKTSLQISREIPVTKIARMISGPEVRGTKPVLVNFVHWKDREEVLRKSTFLRGTNIYITEDLSRRMREHRQELHKYARQIRSRSPQKKVNIRNDKLFIDNQMYIFDEEKNEVIPFTRPPSPPRVPSRNYSAVDNELRRSTSVHSVNGEAMGPAGTRSILSPRGAPGSATYANGDVVSRGGAGGKFSSTESLHLGTITIHESNNGVAASKSNGHQLPVEEAPVVATHHQEQQQQQQQQQHNNNGQHQAGEQHQHHLYLRPGTGAAAEPIPEESEGGTPVKAAAKEEEEDGKAGKSKEDKKKGEEKRKDSKEKKVELVEDKDKKKDGEEKEKKKE